MFLRTTAVAMLVIANNLAQCCFKTGFDDTMVFVDAAKELLKGHVSNYGS